MCITLSSLHTNSVFLSARFLLAHFSSVLLSVKVVLVKYLVLTLGSICGEHVKAEGIPDRFGEAMGKQKQKIETWLHK